MVKPKKSLGQHFLRSSGVDKKIANALQVTPEDTVIEIGPGTGVLTEELLKREHKKLVEIELDKELADLLKERFKNFPNFELINTDATKVDFCQFGKNLKLAGNLPYNVGSLIVLNTIRAKDCIGKAVYMLQKEVAERLTLKHKKPSWLGVLLNTFFDTEYLMSVPARFFYPPPKVTSAVISMVPKKEQPSIDVEDYKRFLEKLFSQRRKMLKQKLPAEILKKAQIKESARVEELKVEDFLNLFKMLHS